MKYGTEVNSYFFLAMENISVFSGRLCYEGVCVRVDRNLFGDYTEITKGLKWLGTTGTHPIFPNYPNIL